VRRREALALIAGMILDVPAIAEAQEPHLPVVGILAVASPENAGAQRNLAATREALAEAGFVEGRTVAFEYRWASTDYDRLPELAADLVMRKVDVIVTEGGTPSAWAAKQATSTIPVVFHVDTDPVAAGLIASLARPGGNLTGISLHSLEGKRIELIVDLVPHATTIAFLVNPKAIDAEGQLRDSRQAASAKHLAVQVVTASVISNFDAVFAELDRSRPDALIVMPNPLFSRHADEVIAGVAQLRIPTMYSGLFFVERGGLLSYGTSFVPMYHRKGVLAAKILKGAKPADLPVEQPDSVELTINLKTAMALGLTVPQSLLLRVDKVIE
jgi:putative ABC transport system substrate-binding protein